MECLVGLSGRYNRKICKNFIANQLLTQRQHRWFEYRKQAVSVVSISRLAIIPEIEAGQIAVDELLAA